MTAFFSGVVLLLGASVLFYDAAERQIIERTHEQFQSIAALLHDRIESILDKNIERVKLVSSRTQLRLSLRQYLADKGGEQRDRMRRILKDAQNSIPSFQTMTLFDLDGQVIVTTAENGKASAALYPEALLSASRKRNNAETFILGKHRELLFLLGGPLFLDGELLGVLIIESEPRELIATVSNYEGLHETGETLLLKKRGTAGDLFLLPTRFDPLAALTRTQPGHKDQDSGSGFEDFKFHVEEDYRGRATLSLWQPMTTNDWQIEVKIDRAEVLAGLADIRLLVIKVTVAFLVFAFFISFFLARHVTRPITLLTDLARRIAAGDYSLRADDASRDEIGSLGKSFNLMARNLIRKQSELSEKVEQLEAEIVERERAEQEIERLRGILPLCSVCKKVRDDEGAWHNVDSYIQNHSQADVSHSLCPACMAKKYPDIYTILMTGKKPGEER